jgi:hypothetical protein
VAWSTRVAWLTRVAWSTRVAWQTLPYIVRTRPSPWRRSVRGSRNTLSLFGLEKEKTESRSLRASVSAVSPVGRAPRQPARCGRAVHQGSQRGHACCQAPPPSTDGSWRRAASGTATRSSRASVRPVISVPRSLAHGTNKHVRSSIRVAGRPV